MSPSSIQILTPTGFRPFTGIERYWHETSRVISFSDGTIVNAADLHRFICDDGREIFGKDIDIGLSLMGKDVTSNLEGSANWFYDPINVGNGAVYTHDGGLVSHNSFHGTGTTLINADNLLGMKAEHPLSTNNGVNVYAEPVLEHNYVMTVDVAKGRGQDYSTFTVFDVSEKPFTVVATFRSNLMSPLLFPDIIYKCAKMYNSAYIVVESNDQGSVVCNGLYYDLEYENMYVESTVKTGALGLTTTKKTKRIGCSNLKDLIEQKKLIIVDADMISELSTFSAVGSSYEATDGNHDDTVMTLVIFSWFVATDIFTSIANIDLKSMLYSERLQMIEEDIVPIGSLGDMEDHSKRYEVDKDGIPWETAGNEFF